MNSVKVTIEFASSVIESNLSEDDLDAVGEYFIDIDSGIDKRNWANVALDTIAVKIPMSIPEDFVITVLDESNKELHANPHAETFCMDQYGCLK
jgi:hypothetical protein